MTSARARRAAVLLAIVAAFGVGHSFGSPSSSSPPSVAIDANAAATATSTLSARYGAKQAKTHLALVRTAPIVPFIRTLRVGDSGASVRLLQRALVKAKARPSRARATGHYGKITGRQLAAFQRSHKIRPASGVYGPKTHHALSPFYDLSARRELQAVAHTRTILAYQARIVSAASVAWRHRMSMAYSQSGTRALLPALPNWPPATDCSGYATWLFKVSGLPDPNGFAYVVVGYTGTLARHGARIPANGALRAGDLVFYGGGYPYGHVAIVIDGFRRLVTSHGSPGIKVVPFNYRPVSAVRRYF